jgi:RNA polymerase sigma-70 factor (ECF subfamily)
VPSDPATDHDNLFALQQGESAALNRLIARWQRPLINFAYRYVQNSTDAHDLAAETFVKLYQQRLKLRADTKLSAWLFTTLSNLCHNHQRWKRRHPTVALGTADHSSDDSAERDGTVNGVASELPTPDTQLEKNEMVAAVRSAIDLLPHDLKVTLLLHHYEHLSYREIAAIAGCSERGVETRLYRARQQLRERLSSQLAEANTP